MCLAAPLYTPELCAPGVGAHTNVGNVEALKGLTGPNELGLNNTRVKNLDALKELTGLSVLDLQGSQVRDVDVLKGLTHLTQLGLPQTLSGQDVDALKAALPGTQFFPN